MDAEHSHDLGSLLVQALDLPAEERAAFLDKACPTPHLRAEVNHLVQDYLDAATLFNDLDDGLRAQFVFLAETAPRLADDDPYQFAGQTVAHYAIVQPLGAGGMGVVYEARDTRLKRTVALKFLPPLLSHNADARQRFLVEAQAAAALEHPNICTIHEIGQTEAGHPFISMAYYAGQTLKDRIARGALPVAEAVEVAVCMADALTQAHQRDIVHRDIKPANVMLTDDGQVKLLDFGLAKRQDTGLTRTGTTLGTVAYMSPEQARSDLVDHRTDIWSLGVVLYEMLAGERPFRGAYEHAVIYSILHQEPEPLTTHRPETPETLAQIVRRALAKDPTRRFADMQRFLDALRAFRQGRSLAAPPVPAPSKDQPSIAVLPFADMSPARDQDYFCEGVAEEILNALTRIDGLRVASRTSSFQFKDETVDARQIGARLNVTRPATPPCVARRGVRPGPRPVQPRHRDRPELRAGPRGTRLL